MAGTFTYNGFDTRGYISYIDLATDRMLIAEPGESYGMRSNEENFPVPPGDGRWEAVKPAPPSPPAPAAKPLVTAPASTEGGAA